MHRLTLIYPAIGHKPGKPSVRSWQMQPLSIARLAAMTPPNWQTTFMDDRVEPVNENVETDLVGISIETYTAKRGYQIAARFRARGIPVVLGGYHATLCPEEAVQHADAICVGEAEGVWENILADAAAGHLKPRYQNKTSLPLENIRPDRSIFDGKKYLPIALVESSRGCPFQCHFCSIGGAYQGSFRQRSIPEIVEELRTLKERVVFFVDDNIVGNPSTARELFRAIAPLGIRWISQGSLNALRDESLLQEMARSGCIGLLVGFESLDARNLEAMGKRINHVEEYSGVLHAMRRAGMLVYGTFMFGYPHDTETSFEATVKFARKQGLLLGAFNHLVPFPGTPLYRDLAEQNRFPKPEWWLDENFSFGQVPFNPTSLSAKQIEAGCLRARRSFYSWPSMIQRFLTMRPPARMVGTYWLLNLMLRREISQKAGIPLGIRE